MFPPPRRGIKDGSLPFKGRARVGMGLILIPGTDPESIPST